MYMLNDTCEQHGCHEKLVCDKQEGLLFERLWNRLEDLVLKPSFLRSLSSVLWQHLLYPYHYQKMKLELLTCRLSSFLALHVTCA
jgi:hypothetical protein